MKLTEKIGRWIGIVLSVTLAVCAWLLLVLFTLKAAWFILFRILL